MPDEPTSPPGRGVLRHLNLHRISLPLVAAIGAVGIFAPKVLSGAADALTESVFGALDWFFMASVTALLVLAIWLAFGRHGSIRLGRPGERPEFSTASWLAMLFAAGMGVGLLFWGVAEPMIHFSSPPVGEGGTAKAARQAMVITNFHWGFHAWAIYGLAAMVLAYFRFRRDALYLAGAPVRAMFKGRWVEPVAMLADLVAVAAVVFGVAGSLGMGVFQLVAGLHVVAGIPADSKVWAGGILALLVVCYMLSASTGIERGIKWLSNANMIIAILLMFFLLIAGPTGFLLRTVVTSLGDYLVGMMSLSLKLYPYQDMSGWMKSWTLTYFIWWIAWAPFVGLFIARISRGRTIKQFVLGVTAAPTLFSILWFGVFGGTGMYEELYGAGGVARLVSEDVTLALFSLFDRLPLSGLLSVTALVLVFIFLVTSVDSATFVLGMLTSGGTLNPPTSRKFAWGVTVGVLSAAITFMGDINVLRSVTVSGAVPYSLILLLQTACLIKALRREGRDDAPAGEDAS